LDALGLCLRQLVGEDFEQFGEIDTNQALPGPHPQGFNRTIDRLLRANL